MRLETPVRPRRWEGFSLLELMLVAAVLVGGGNGIQYDHCWADNLLARVPFTPPPSTLPLKILSVRTVTY